MIYFLKPEINRFQQSSNGNPNNLGKNTLFRGLVILVHHLFMFSMQEEIFPKKYQQDFPYSTFMEI